jgi:hypothetical protein
MKSPSKLERSLRLEGGRPRPSFVRWLCFNLLLALVLGLVAPTVALGQSPEVAELRQRVAARAPVITRLKSAGLVREGATGQLEMTTQLTEQDTQAV